VEVLVQGSLVTLERVYINAGSRGFLVGMDPEDLIRITEGRLVDVAAG
jgi:prolyl-tRNA editing enzyme YbaK/EbsC (Cys-tRNA(Pro) deacylase)